MDPPQKAKAVRTQITDDLMGFDPTNLSSAQDLLSSLSTTLKTSNIISELAETNPDAAQNLHENLQALQEMQVLVGQTQAAQAVGDMDAMMAFSQSVAALGGLDLTDDPLPAPFDALAEAIEDNDIATVTAMLATSPDLNQNFGHDRAFPLIWAMRAEGRNVAMLETLVAGVADVTFATPEGYTALHSLADYDFGAHEPLSTAAEIADWLVAQGADLTARNTYGWTPLDRAIFEGRARQVKALLQAGADPNLHLPQGVRMSFETGRTPLSNALPDPKSVAALIDAEPGDDPAFVTGLRASRELILAAQKDGDATF